MDTENIYKFKIENLSYNNLIVFNNGSIDLNSTKISTDKIKIYNLNEYYSMKKSIEIEFIQATENIQKREFQVF